MTRPLRHRPSAALLLAAVALTGLAGVAAARIHDDLQSATPGPDDRVDVAPTELRLRFTGSVSAALARVGLAGPDGEVRLGELTQPEDSARLIVAPVRGPLRAGEYAVSWRIIGGDGHPVEGSYRFVILDDAAGLEPRSPERDTAAPAAPAHERVDDARADAAVADGGGFGSRSALYVLVRWLGYVALLPLLGAIAFRWIVLPLTARRRQRRPAERPDLALARRAAGVGLMAAGGLILATVARLAAQAFVLAGGSAAPDLALLGTMIGGTTWGIAWVLQLAAVAIAAAGLHLARRGVDLGWTLALLAVLPLGIAPALSGHAAAGGALSLPVVLDTLHILAAGGWLGTLLVVLLVAVPASRGGPGGLLSDIVAAFSIAALTFAAVLVATGVGSALQHVATTADLFGTRYGRTLLLKIGVLIPLFGAGWYNFRRVRPQLDADGGPTLRRTGGGELAVAALVLLVTAVLVATPPPAAGDERTATTDVQP